MYPAVHGAVFSSMRMASAAKAGGILSHGICIIAVMVGIHVPVYEVEALVQRTGLSYGQSKLVCH